VILRRKPILLIEGGKNEICFAKNPTLTPPKPLQTLLALAHPKLLLQKLLPMLQRLLLNQNLLTTISATKEILSIQMFPRSEDDVPRNEAKESTGTASEDDETVEKGDAKEPTPEPTPKP
jgi:hypothetical protein